MKKAMAGLCYGFGDYFETTNNRKAMIIMAIRSMISIVFSTVLRFMISPLVLRRPIESDEAVERLERAEWHEGDCPGSDNNHCGQNAEQTFTSDFDHVFLLRKRCITAIPAARLSELF